MGRRNQRGCMRERDRSLALHTAALHPLDFPSGSGPSAFAHAWLCDSAVVIRMSEPALLQLNAKKGAVTRPIAVTKLACP
uniref:Uncharacterized protein n=1 Tax=Ascaris lumbricoides TaxID=6252 RepID=A0A0M3IF50_ASCLU